MRFWGQRLHTRFNAWQLGHHLARDFVFELCGPHAHTQARDATFQLDEFGYVHLTGHDHLL